MNLEQTNLGYELKTPHFTLLFGGLQAQTESLRGAYPNFQFRRLKQIHSDAILQTTSESPDYQNLGDSHWTTEKNLALCVITADCVPVFFFDPKSKTIAGIHAGWRGVAARIIPKTIERLLHVNDIQPENLQVFIGPHIQKKSFEVGLDVRDQILSSLGPLSPHERAEFAESLPENKALVDLHKIVQFQLAQSHVQEENTHSLYIDTVTDLRFHSHRRDKDKAGRQVSFIVRTS